MVTDSNMLNLALNLVSKMTYYASSGMLNSTHSLTHYQHGVRLGLTTFTYLFNFIINVSV